MQIGGQERWGVPVVPIDSAGFYGTKNLGNRIAGDAMVKYVIGTRDPDPLPLNSCAFRH
jgi:nitrogenase molybdenum-cofactor synthesis protein NifE